MGGGGMAADGEEARWMCGRAGVVNLHSVSSIVREIQEPCLHRSPAKGNKMLKPEKWQATFDSDGKVIRFRKALKLIVLGGVDPSIRAEVWEFLLGCYAVSTTTEFREQLRMARRERYEDLIRQCQMMHSSIGTGNLACIVGSKVMDMRTSSRQNDIRKAGSQSGRASNDATYKLGSYSGLNNDSTDTPCTHQRESSSDSAEFVSGRGSTESAIYNSSYAGPSSSGPYNSGGEVHEPQYLMESYFDFPSLPVTNLFQRGDSDGRVGEMYDSRTSAAEYSLKFEDDHMHSFHASNNVDLMVESNASSSVLYCGSNSDSEILSSGIQEQAHGSEKKEYKTETESRLRILDVPEAAKMNVTMSNGLNVNEDRVSEWIWTLHRIVVDVVRTDNHLEFYGDSKNMARMSDILAVYAWVDPSIGYCQGMSDLLSPFVVLFEDNADAFWCFEMLLRRMREHFQMEGPTGVMKQLQALWKILELTDGEIYEHLTHIGAESLHFAFRMLLVLFRRELSFHEALCMWEMMWAVDFDEALAQQLEENCLGPLVVRIQENSNAEPRAQNSENDKINSKSAQLQHIKDITRASYSDGVKSIASYPLCGLTRANFWPRQSQLQISSGAASAKRWDDELPVFCVAAILIINRRKIMRETNSIDDVIKMFNDNMLKINVKRCIRMAIKLRKKYFYKLIKQASMGYEQQKEENV